MWKLTVAYDGQDKWSVTEYPDLAIAVLSRDLLLKRTRKSVRWTAITKKR